MRRFSTASIAVYAWPKLTLPSILACSCRTSSATRIWATVLSASLASMSMPIFALFRRLIVASISLRFSCISESSVVSLRVALTSRCALARPFLSSLAKAPAYFLPASAPCFSLAPVPSVLSTALVADSPKDLPNWSPASLPRAASISLALREIAFWTPSKDGTMSRNAVPAE